MRSIYNMARKRYRHEITFSHGGTIFISLVSACQYSEYSRRAADSIFIVISIEDMALAIKASPTRDADDFSKALVDVGFIEGVNSLLQAPAS